MLQPSSRRSLVFTRLCACALLAGTSAGTSSCEREEPGARAYPIEAMEQAIGGPKAIAREGDFVLENPHARIAMLGARNSLGPGLFGGSVVDADIVRNDPQFSGGRGLDQLAELFPTVNMNVPQPDPEDEGSVEILSDGSSGEAVIRVRGPGIPFLSLLDALWNIVGAPDFYLWTDVIARRDEPWFTLRTTISTAAGADEPPPSVPTTYHNEPFPLIQWAIESGLVLGDFYLQGGSVNVFAPGIGFDEDGAVFESMERGENTFLQPFQFPFLAGVADGVSYGLAPVEGDIFVPLFTASQTVAVGGAQEGDGTPTRFPADQSYTYERYFFVGHGDVGSVLDQYLAARKIESGTLSGAVLEQTTQQPVTGISVFVYAPGAEAPFSQLETDVHPDDRSPDGSFRGNLPVGTWELAVHQQGRPDQERVTVDIKKGQETSVSLAAGRFGVLEFTVRDEMGRLVPAKVTLFRDDDRPTSLDPVLGDSYIAGDPEAVVFSLYGTGEVELPPGRYYAVASRGLEYEIDRSPSFTLDAANGAELELQVVRSVDTTGWISADLHVHAEASHDSGVLLADRVRTMVTEGVEFFASTDHDYLVDYAPTVEALGVEQWVQTAVGNETTTVEIGHFLAFPLSQDFLTEAGGGREEVDWTGKTPADIIDSLETMGKAGGHDPFVFVGHPRDGILGYFDQYGFSAYEGQPGLGGDPGIPSVSQPLLSLTNPLLAPGNISWDFDGIEILNGKRFEFIRTPTSPEMEAYAAGGSDVWEFMTRTLAEQQELADDIYRLSPDVDGIVDDWFTLLNLGFTYTALGNSDTHGTTSTESGCPRNYVLLGEDDPAFLDDQAVAEAVREHRVVASYGPFVTMTLDGQPIGSTLQGEGSRELAITVQAPSWIPVDRVEVYENGTLIQEFEVPADVGVERFVQTVEVTPTKDSWYVVIVAGEGDLSPVFTAVEIPYVELQLVVSEALGGVGSVSALLEPAPPIPKQFPIRPYALTNPIWVDLAGDGFDAPGIPGWLREPN